MTTDREEWARLKADEIVKKMFTYIYSDLSINCGDAGDMVYAALLEAATVKLPKRFVREDFIPLMTGRNSEMRGFNECLDKLRALNPTCNFVEGE